MISKIHWFYSNTRAHRSEWIFQRFIEELKECTSLLDVGCSQSALKLFLPKTIHYLGIDVDGKPDLKIDLDTVSHLPFENNQFDAVVCADVLEHLENIHGIFDELCRVVKRYLIITLPNPAYGMYRYLLRVKYVNKQKHKKYGKYMKYYGLPVEKPGDRHRWFYGYDEAINFVKHRTQVNGLNLRCIENNLMYEKKKHWKRIAANIAKYINPNLAFRDIIFLMSKEN